VPGKVMDAGDVVLSDENVQVIYPKPLLPNATVMHVSRNNGVGIPLPR
jgi:hypothetical protein